MTLVFLRDKGSFKQTLPVVIVLLIISTGSINAQTKQLIDDPAFTIDATAAIDSLYNRNNHAAAAILKPWRENYPTHPLWRLWAGMELWWELLEDLDLDEFDDLFIDTMRDADFQARRVLQDEPDHIDALVVIAVSNSYIARLHSNRERWITSLQVGRRGYQAHLRLMQIKPDLADNYFAEGMKLYYSAYVQEEYPVVRPVASFLPDGDREAGQELLREAIEKSLFSRAEASYFLATIQLNYEDNFAGAKSLYRSLVDQYPDNGYYRRLYMNTLAQLREYSSMIAFQDETKAHWSEQQLARNPVMEYELYYWVGRAYYFHLDSRSAYNSFVNAVESANSLENNKNRNFYTLSAYFAGRASEDLGLNETACHYYKIAADQKAAPEVIRRARNRLNALKI